jgi:hypothetical protein
MANADEGRPVSPGEDALSGLALDLELTADQVDRVRERLRAGTAGMPRLDVALVTTQLRAFGDAFRGETFDARFLDAAAAANATIAGWGASHMARVIALITPAQRESAARTLLEHAGHNPSGEASR